MKMPMRPPELSDLMAKEEGKNLLPILQHARPVDAKGRYLHWDQMRHRTPPEDLNHEQWWLATSFSRMTSLRSLPLTGVGGVPFRFSNVDQVQEMVHRIDQQASGNILTDDQILSPQSSDRYLVSSLMEEAITSSLLEGAATTRRVAKDLLRSGRDPVNKGEQMILNNFSAMRAAQQLAQNEGPLTPDDVLEMHRIVTSGTLDDEGDAGRLQSSDETRVSVLWDKPVWDQSPVLHEPPPASELPARLERLCKFANGELDEGFIHPVIRAIVLHFCIAYDHPFVDGNGRVARALFYWAMLRYGYWLFQYLSISAILRKAPSKYAESYLYVETDNNDLTYFIIYQLRVIEQAVEGLRGYISRKASEIANVESLLRGNVPLNHRQTVAVSKALRDTQQSVTISAHARLHQVTIQSARTDLLGLEHLGLFSKRRVGKRFVFTPARDLPDRLRALAD